MSRISDPAHPHDTIIIGAGPAGLAVAARLCEDTPSAIFTDEEHRRYHWIQKHADRATIKNKKTGHLKLPKNASTSSDGSEESQSSTSTKPDKDILVLDSSSNEWMSRWKQLFKRFQISHLRSPMFFHVDPNDRDGLLAYAHEHKRDNELVEITGCVGKEISKHKQKKTSCSSHKRKNSHCQCGPQAPTEIDERDRKDYFTPPSSLFTDFCTCVIRRYGLFPSDLIRKEAVLDIDYTSTFHPDSGAQLFKVVTNSGVHYSRTVVLAIGAGGAPRIPASMSEIPVARIEGACHAFAIETFPDEGTKKKIQAGRVTNVMVVGGGLTSAQLSDMAIRHGVSKVWHIMRGPMKVKPFDVDLAWLGKYKNRSSATFWSADTDEERLDLLLSARNGGSITPRFAKILKAHCASTSTHSTPRLSIHTHTTLASSSFSSETQTWTITTTPPIPALPAIDYIYFATGVSSDISALPLLDSMRRQYPIESVGGMPVLTDELGWKKGVPLFVAGRMAALRLGPGAGNLEGARGGAERIAWGVGDVLEGVEQEQRDRERKKSLVMGEGEEGGMGTEKVKGEEEEGTEDDGSDGDAEYCYHAGIGSRYASLGDDDGDSDADDDNNPRNAAIANPDEEAVMQEGDDDGVVSRQIPRLVAGLSLS